MVGAAAASGASDVEMSSPVFNDSKYDNTRKV